MKYLDKGFENDKYLHLYGLEKGQWDTGDISKCFREMGHFILREMGHGKRDTLSSGIWTTYPLGNILWESGIRALRYNQYDRWGRGTRDDYRPCLLSQMF